jgi:hypothetical protein
LNQFDEDDGEEIFQNEPKKKYDLKPRPSGSKADTSAQTKNSSASVK